MNTILNRTAYVRFLHGKGEGIGGGADEQQQGKRLVSIPRNLLHTEQNQSCKDLTH